MARQADRCGQRRSTTAAWVRWIRRSLEDDALVRRIDEAVQTARSTRGGTLEDPDPGAGALRARPGGADPLSRPWRSCRKGWARRWRRRRSTGGDPQPVAEMVAAQLPMFWINVQPAFRPEFRPPRRSSSTGCAAGWRRKTVGLGLEALPLRASQPRPALPERHAGGLSRRRPGRADPPRSTQIGRPGPAPAGPIDRHIAGFILSRKPGMADRLFLDLDPIGRKLVRAAGAGAGGDAGASGGGETPPGRPCRDCARGWSGSTSRPRSPRSTARPCASG